MVHEMIHLTTIISHDRPVVRSLELLLSRSSWLYSHDPTLAKDVDTNIRKLTIDDVEW